MFLLDLPADEKVLGEKNLIIPGVPKQNQWREVGFWSISWPKTRRSPSCVGTRRSQSTIVDPCRFTPEHNPKSREKVQS